MSNSTQNDKQKVTRADIKVTMTFYPREGTQCGYCGISSFAHRHKAGSLPKDFERLPDASKTIDTQNDTKKEDVLLQVANMDRIVREKWFIDWLKNHDKAILADARKEVGNGIEKMYLSVADKDPRYDTVEEIQAYNQAIYEILATLKEERV